MIDGDRWDYQINTSLYSLHILHLPYNYKEKGGNSHIH